MKYQIEQHRIALGGALNVRDLGGYPTKNGVETRRGVFLRGDSTAGLTKEDCAVLKGMGLSLVLDLRSPAEAEKSPSVFREDAQVDYENCAMFDGLQSSFFQGDGMPASLSQLYCDLLDAAKQQYARVFTRLLETPGMALYHCTAGKDRTGLVSMLLLELAGVPEEVIVADYAATEEFIRPLTEKQLLYFKQHGIDVPEYAMRSEPCNAERTLAYLHSRYGSARDYLLACGLTQKQAARLQNKLLC